MTTSRDKYFLFFQSYTELLVLANQYIKLWKEVNDNYYTIAKFEFTSDTIDVVWEERSTYGVEETGVLFIPIELLLGDQADWQPYLQKEREERLAATIIMSKEKKVVVTAGTKYGPDGGFFTGYFKDHASASKAGFLHIHEEDITHLYNSLGKDLSNDKRLDYVLETLNAHWKT